jgi:hypothetical protein
MISRRFRAFILFAASLLVAVATATGVSIATAGPASASPEIKICLTNLSSYCADVKDSDNVSGQPIWLYQLSAGAKDYYWYEVPVPCTDSYCLCDGVGCIEFEDAQNPNLCLGVSSNLAGISLIGCELTEGGTGRAAWISSVNSHYLVNYFKGAPSGYLAVNSPSTGRYLFPSEYVAPGGSVYEQWTGP